MLVCFFFDGSQRNLDAVGEISSLVGRIFSIVKTNLLGQMSGGACPMCCPMLSGGPSLSVTSYLSLDSAKHLWGVGLGTKSVLSGAENIALVGTRTSIGSCYLGALDGVEDTAAVIHRQEWC